MKITWLGHSGFRIETGGAVILVDPWLRGNPSFDEARFDDAIAGATHVLVTHGHGDHASTAAEIAKATGAPLVGIYDWVTWVAEAEGVEGIGFNKGGTVDLAGVAATMVAAVHSSSVAGPGGQPVYAGAEAGYVLEAEGRRLYVAGDTDVTAEMGVVQALHEPTHAILPIGGHFTMDAKRAAHAVKTYFPGLRGVIPCHYRTFPLLAQSADEFAGLIAPVPVHAPEVMGSVEI